MSDTDSGAARAFIDRWAGSGGRESGAFQSFANELCALLGVAPPDPPRADIARNDYTFERALKDRVTGQALKPDLYARGRFIMEGKQSSPARDVDPDQLSLPGQAEGRHTGQAVRGTRAWDKVMRAAYRQARNYVAHLPEGHENPPFVLVADVGHVIDVYADFSGQGRYAPFPDRRAYRIGLEELAEEGVRDRLRAIWKDPQSLDPARISARVTQDIARRLAKIARALEAKTDRETGEKVHDPKAVAEFLMRCLFCMFAEDVKDREGVHLLPGKAFEQLLRSKINEPAKFPAAVEAFWRDMDQGAYNGFADAQFRRFNGQLFTGATALRLNGDQITELAAAAGRGWEDVEPAIFGTLLEQALDPRERGQLGAHFTPRAYVERLVVPTIIEPLTADWEDAQAEAEAHEAAGEHEAALASIRGFHRRLCNTRVLDPACGTGNFLYVALELMKALEGDVLNVLEGYEAGAGTLGLDDETVSPRQFYGLEINPRAVPIAELVLWLGYIKQQIRAGGVASLTDPVLNNLEGRTIRVQDAILAYDDKALLLGPDKKPVTRWDGYTMKPHPVTGEAVPDEAARVEAYTYEGARRAEWPEADFIVGNPPFIGGKDMRAELGDGYAEAAWAARPEVPGGADFVMHFWDEAAGRLLAEPTKAAAKRGARNRLRRFGFITTNSVTQTFSRRVIERHLSAKAPLSLAFAVADHPWMKASDKAAVRIAMTVARRGEGEGVLAEVVSEAGLNTDTPEVVLRTEEGIVTANLTLGANVASVQGLLSNDALSSRGVSLHGAGFIVSQEKARALGLGTVPGLEEHILDYRNGRDLAARSRDVRVIDLYGLEADAVRTTYPDVYEHLTEHVRPHRQAKRGKSKDANAYADEWWLFGKVRTELRAFLDGLPRYIATVETTKHRTFQFLDASVRPDNMLVNVGTDRADVLAVLSSRFHVAWSLAAGGWLGVGNDARYSKTRTFDPFPFPSVLTDPDGDTARLAALGERLNAERKDRLAAWDWLTMTRLYNALERYREAMAGGAPLTDAERDVHERARVTLLAELHDEIDRAVLDAYGWSDLAGDLVGRPGGTTPSAHKTPAQEAAEEALLVRLVALNQERAAEERRGHVRWLRPDYQRAKLGHKVPDGDQAEAELAVAASGSDRPAWPLGGLGPRIRAVRDVLEGAGAPVAPDAVAAAFAGRTTKKRGEQVAEVLDGLAEMGLARRVEGVGYAAVR